MVALGGVLQHLQVAVELYLRGKRGSVDARQLLILLASLPVGAGNREEAECTELPRIRDMRTQTQVHEVAGPVEPRRRVRDLVADQLHLERLVQPLEERDRVGPRQLLLGERQPRLDDLPHSGFDPWQLLR